MERAEMMDAMITLAGTVVLKVDLDWIVIFLYFEKLTTVSYRYTLMVYIQRCSWYMMLYLLLLFVAIVNSFFPPQANGVLFFYWLIL